jgi:WD40 repeat protein
MIRLIVVSLVLFSVFAPVLAQTESGQRAVIESDNIKNLTLLSTLGYGQVEAMAYSPNGKLLAISTLHSVQLYSTEAIQDAPRVLEGGGSALAFNSDRQIVTVAGDKVQLRDTATGKAAFTFEGNQFALRPDGQAIVTVNQHALMLWDTNTGKKLDTYALKKDQLVERIQFMPDGKHLLILDSVNGLYLWGFENHSIIRDYENTRLQFFTDIAVSLDGKLIAASGLDGRLVWNTQTGELQLDEDRFLSSPFQTVTVFSHDGKRLIYGDADGGIDFYQTLDFQAEKMLTTLRQPDAVQTLALSPDDKMMTVATSGGFVTVYDLTSTQKYATLAGYSRSANVVGLTHDNATLVAANIQGTFWRWDVRTGKQLSIQQGYTVYYGHGTYPGMGSAIALNLRANLIAAGSVIDGIISLHTPRGQRRGILELGRPTDIYDLSFSRDGRKLAVLASSGISLWDLKTITRVTGFATHTDCSRSVMLSPDGSLVAVGDDTGVCLLDGLTGKTRYQIPSEGYASKLTFSADGNVLAFSINPSSQSTSKNPTILLVDTPSGKIVGEYKGHMQAVSALAFNPGASLLVSASEDGTVRIWDVQSGQEILELSQAASTLAFSDDGTLLAIGNSDGTVEIWGSPEQ